MYQGTKAMRVQSCKYTVDNRSPLYQAQHDPHQAQHDPQVFRQSALGVGVMTGERSGKRHSFAPIIWACRVFSCAFKCLRGPVPGGFRKPPEGLRFGGAFTFFRQSLSPRTSVAGDVEIGFDTTLTLFFSESRLRRCVQRITALDFPLAPLTKT